MATSDILLWIIGSLAIVVLLSIFLGRKKPKRVTLTPPLGNLDQAAQDINFTEPRAFSTGSFSTATEPFFLDNTFDEFGLHDNLATVIHPQEEIKKPVYPQTPVSEKIIPKPFVNKPIVPSPKIVSIYVMAKEGKQFFGYELLQALSAAGLVYGKMNIFHRYADQEPEKLLFSVASAMEPGIFDLDNMGGFACPGVTLFMRVDPQASAEFKEYQFSILLQVAEQLAEDLDGRLLDNEREPFTDEKFEAYYQVFEV